MEFLEATYRLVGKGDTVEERIESVLLEQTVETPISVAERYPYVREKMLGSVREIVPDGDGGYLATLSLPIGTASADPAQFLNVLFGNSSLHEDVVLVDFVAPPSALDLFGGPGFGIPGIREITGIVDRPLTCGALKPAGLQVAELSDICRRMAEGGIDLVKDDHYLADQSFSPFEERVRSCQDAVEDVAARTGHRATYIPNLSGTPDAVKRQAAFAQDCGVGAVMVAPMLLGLPTFFELCSSTFEVPVLAHPSFSGSVAIRPPVLLGKLFRLFGADAVIFANYGGRFSFPPEVCTEVANSLRADWMHLNTAFPVPAGGMDADRASELVRFFGLDTILLVGGSLLEAGEQLRDKTESFTKSVQTAAYTVKNAL